MQKTTTKSLPIIVCLLIAFLLFILCLSLMGIPLSNIKTLAWDGSTALGFSNGNGDIATPYEISNGETLAFLAESVNNGNDYANKYFILTADISLNDTTYFSTWDSTPPSNVWTTIGYFDDLNSKPFKGTFNGNNKTISGLYCETNTYGGLFGYVDGSIIYDLYFDYAYLSCFSNAGILAGTLQNESEVSNIIITNSVVLGRDFISPEEVLSNRLGGICGYLLDSSITSASSNAIVTCSEACGGLVGEAYASTITDCIFKGEVYAIVNTGGGIAGISDADINNCVSKGIVKGDSRIGALVGNNNSLATLSKCLSLADIVIQNPEDATNIGALVGINYGTIEDCFYDITQTNLYTTGGSTAFDECGKATIDLVGNSLSEYLTKGWALESNDDNNYFYPQLASFYEADNSFIAYEISLFYNSNLYSKFLNKQNVTTTLPIIEEAGYTYTWQTEDGGNWGDTVESIAPTENISYYAKKTIDNPIIVEESNDIDTTFDNQYHNLSITATTNTDIQYLKYEWYYSQTFLGEYTSKDVDTYSISTKFVIDSGYYYCNVWIDDGSLASEKIKSKTFVVNIAKADIIASSVPYLRPLIGTYNPLQKLSNFTLPTNFYWETPTLVPSCDKNYAPEDMGEGYSVYYNLDLDNYNSVYVTAYIYLNKATYVDIEHDVLSGTYLSTQKLSDFELDSGFAWIDDTITPIVSTTKYAAIYNGDSINYNDYYLDITLNLEKAIYIDITHTDLAGTYDANKTLADYPLYNSYYSWVIESTVPTVLVTKYAALYNMDSDNYFDYQFFITLNIGKATPTVTPQFNTPSKIFVNDSLPTISVGSSNTIGTISWDSYTLTKGENICFWTFAPNDSDNYKVKKDSVTFNVLVEEVVEIEITTPPTVTTYYALSEVNTSGMVITAIYNNDSREVVTNYQIVYVSGSSFIYGDTAFDIVYSVGQDDFTATQSVTINKIVIAIPTITATFYYNGNMQSHGIAPSDFFTVENTKYSLANTYYITATLNDKTNYCWADATTADKSIQWVINPKEIVKPTINGNYTYNGLLQKADIVENACYSIGNNYQKFVGDYVVTVELIDKNNYCWSGGGTGNLSLNFSITRYHVDLPIYTESNFIYNRTPQKAVITKSIFVYFIDNDTHTDAGSYSAEVILKDKDNYCWVGGNTDNLYFPFIISKRVVEMPSFSGTYTYNGLPQKAKINTNEAYDITGDTQTNAGEYIVTVSINANNYEWEEGGNDSIEFTFIIAKLKIAKPIISDTYIYNGEEQQVNIALNDYYIISEQDLTFVNAGDYIVSIALLNVDNTEWADGGTAVAQISFSVAKKAVARISLDLVSFTYTGTAINYNLPIDKPLFNISGNVNTNVGSYSVEITLKYTNNYKWASGGLDSCTVLWQILPQKVTKPQCTQTNNYLGYEQNAPIAESTKYTLSGNKATNAGSYTATVALIDTQNYTWNDTTIAPFTISWQIAKAKVNKPGKASDLFYTGLPQKYAIVENDAYTISGNEAIAYGEYTAVIKLVSTANYEWNDGTTTNLSYDWKVFYLKWNTGEKEEEITAFSDDSILYVPQKTGYNFLGWYANSDYSGEKITSLEQISGDTVLFAKWAEVTILQGNEEPKALSVKAIVGLSVGGVLTLLAIALLILVFTKRGKNGF